MPYGPGWNGSISPSFSPVPMNLIGLPVTALTESAAPPRASPSILLMSTPSMPRASSKVCATVDGVLTGHCVHHEDDLGGLDRCFDVFQLVHQLFVDVQAACGIEENQIIAVLAGKVDAVLCDLDRVALTYRQKRGC